MMMKQSMKLTLPLLVALFTIQCSGDRDPGVIDLSGVWRFALDADKVGADQKWHQTSLAEEVQLPGTTDENGKGILQEEKPTDRLARVWYWKGAAWYQRDVDIPESWEGKRVTLFLERTKNVRVWVNDEFCGWDDSLSAPHVYDVTPALSPGKNTITLLIDNSILPPVGPAHAVDERTQTNWNGVVGKIELRATDPVWIEQVDAYPNVGEGTVGVKAVLYNTTGKSHAGSLQVNCRSTNVADPRDFAIQEVTVENIGKRQVVEFTYDPKEAVPLWDEFDPALLDLTLKLEAGGYADSKSIRFGMREFTTEGSRFLINGESVFLRGRLDCANYPLTGYPPMDKASWQRIIGILKDWGLNHVRFHSWCPPWAAFEVADEMGMYFQAELPNKRSGFKAPENEEAALHNIDRLDVESSDSKVSLYDYGKREGELISKYFGNYASFVMFTLGNELGRNQGMFELVAHFRDIDPRRLYAQGSNNMHWNPSLAEGDDFWVASSVEKDAKPLRGSYAVFKDHLEPHIEFKPPSTLFDFGESIEGVPAPIIGHETGQFQVYPDYRDIAKFTGVTRARNFEIFRERLKEAGMLDQAQDFVDASGKLSAICYREDIEAALRTEGFGGFQLLDIQDFPGQGTALVGMLNDFMESKGIVEPAEWREFCSEVVPLLRMKKYTWTDEENIHGSIQVAHYGPTDLDGALLSVEVKDEAGHVLADAEFHANLPRGGLVEVGDFSQGFACLEPDWPQRLEVTLAIAGTDYRNTYPVWVYPSRVDLSVPEGVLVTRRFQSAKTQEFLQSGGRVLLLPEIDSLPHSVGGAFQTEFWSPMFTAAAKKRGIEPAPGTLGILCDPASPIFNAFPTEFHSNWQWWRLVKNARPIVYDDTPDDYRPLVQVVDNFVRNHKLGLIAETRVGKGSLLICSIDLPALQEYPEARQLLHSLQQYVASEQFDPKVELERKLLDRLLPQ
jgi:hypothetical protein